MAGVTLRTIRYYDSVRLLKPSLVTDTGCRFYTDEDFAKLQQILLLKSLGFSLDEIREMTLGDPDIHFVENSLRLQQKLVRDRIERLLLVEEAIQDASALIRREHAVDWSRMRELIHLTGNEDSIRKQYRNASNISARIRLHQLYSRNRQGWFPWILEQCGLTPGMQVLELGCGDGALWSAVRTLPEGIRILLSDISEGMLRDARHALTDAGFLSEKDSAGPFSFAAFDCGRIPCEEGRFDLAIANHVLFYCEDIPAACREISRVLKPGGKLICGTYGKKHMQEISRLVRSFDKRISLSGENLFDRFGKENGEKLLSPFFDSVRWLSYEDSLCVTEAEPLILYILSCHGNQNRYLTDRYQDFRAFVKRRTDRGFTVTKDAGIFIAVK